MGQDKKRELRHTRSKEIVPIEKQTGIIAHVNSSALSNLWNYPLRSTFLPSVAMLSIPLLFNYSMLFSVVPIILFNGHVIRKHRDVLRVFQTEYSNSVISAIENMVSLTDMEKSKIVSDCSLEVLGYMKSGVLECKKWPPDPDRHVAWIGNRPPQKRHPKYFLLNRDWESSYQFIHEDSGAVFVVNVGIEKGEFSASCISDREIWKQQLQNAYLMTGLSQEKLDELNPPSYQFSQQERVDRILKELRGKTMWDF